MKGRIIKGIGGFYYVKSDEKIIECKARGKFRYNDLTPLVGDVVEISVKNGKGVIEKIFERSSELFRPAVANVTQAFVVFTFLNPDLNLDLLNRFLVLCQFNSLKVILCFNKIDLVDLDKHNKIIGMLKNAGYEVLFLKAKEGYNLELIREKLENNISLFCGPSGVGKSTILNSLLGKEVMKTGDVSEKIGRGKHTTRHSELVEYGEGYIVDTPGFTSLELDFIHKEELQYCFPEFISFNGNCRFAGCLHYKEPNCSVKTAMEENIISPIRYDFYVKTLEEIMNRRNKYD